LEGLSAVVKGEMNMADTGARSRGSMTLRICYYADIFHYPEGGYLWKFLNWAGGLQSNGCEVIWLESISPERTPEEITSAVSVLRKTLDQYGYGNSISMCLASGDPVPSESEHGCIPFAEAVEADLLLSVGYYRTSQQLVDRFRQSALVDYDPGLLQVWISRTGVKIAAYDVYFTTGETVGQMGSPIPDVGLKWHFILPCVSLKEWTPTPTAQAAVFTTVSHWWGDWVDDYDNTKRAGFLPYLDLPRYGPRVLELALELGEDEDDWRLLRQHGWQLRRASEVSSTPADYQWYIQNSLAEFSCAKPSGARLQNAWVSERTICYLASGKPAVVEHTGPSRFLPDSAGLWRFRNMTEAAQALRQVVDDYPNQSSLARALAEEYFDAEKVVRKVLEVALG
jgi:hypothetical protein